jgi:hypothetical protein
MAIYRNTDQKSKTLIEFYTDLQNSSDFISKGIGTSMLQWIERINLEFKETTIWGLTSLYHLTLQAKKDNEYKIYVVLTAGIDEYYIEYRMPKEYEPWENAYVKGVTKSLDDAMKMLKIAMLKSKGWKESSELKNE